MEWLKRAVEQIGKGGHATPAVGVHSPVLAEGHAHAHGLGLGDWYQYVHVAAEATNVVGALLLGLAVALFVLNACVLLLCTLVGLKGRLFFPLDATLHGAELSLATARIALGTLVCCALQLLIVADVLDTLGNPLDQLAFETLGKLVLVIIVREGLAFCMAAEVTHLRHELHEEHGTSSADAADTDSHDPDTTLKLKREKSKGRAH
ncbi:hypothetical protein T492DRAFT_938903 [Pavlovales sp. CCMP2436]|nr:hypothetical protein T492DRAFT_938903 [Pavlovales sp. CCMP2436]